MNIMSKSSAIASRKKSNMIKDSKVSSMATKITSNGVLQIHAILSHLIFLACFLISINDTCLMCDISNPYHLHLVSVLQVVRPICAQRH